MKFVLYIVLIYEIDIKFIKIILLLMIFMMLFSYFDVIYGYFDVIYSYFDVYSNSDISN